MIITENLFAIEEKIKELAELIISSDQARNYYLASEKYSNDEKAILLEHKLQSAYDAFSQIQEQEYGAHCPDYKEKKHAFYQAKRAYDLYGSIADVRLAKADIQSVLDEIAIKVANKVSKKIVVKTGNPFSKHQSKANCQNHCLHQRKER
ncbi:MAG: YlbF family regulator [Lactobacillales bacterium]|jgi:cell fate (sporulation/competence/biofilm development) regulator YlbF (YheA/YmcA/DUF963 family)|nr:YlbF family regulator [Lactobacillales bacterium]